jgi:hypothetical protein
MALDVELGWICQGRHQAAETGLAFSGFVPARGSQTFSYRPNAVFEILCFYLPIIRLIPRRSFVFAACSSPSFFRTSFLAAEKAIFHAEYLLGLEWHITEISPAQSSPTSSSISPSQIRISTAHRSPSSQ